MKMALSIRTFLATQMNSSEFIELIEGVIRGSA
jgi:hypothetical protein